MTFELEGFTIEIDKNAVRELTGSDDVGAALTILGQVGEAGAKEAAPVDTGHLRRSITHELVDLGTENIHERVGTNVVYAIFQELGTRFHPAHPFLRPALSAVEAFLKGL